MKNQNLKIVGSISICNTASINVHEVDDHGEYVIVSINSIKPRKHKLYTNTKGMYFNFCGGRNYLHDVMRVS